jgi:hypothetical protein
MNAVLAKPIPHVLVYSSRGIDKALISIKHLCSAGGFAAPRRATIGRYWGGIIELLHCTMSATRAGCLPVDRQRAFEHGSESLWRPSFSYNVARSFSECSKSG